MLESIEQRILLAGDLVTIANPSPALNDYFGNAVAALSTDRVVIGAFSDDATASDSGIGYIADATSGGILHTLNNPTPAVGDQFGLAVAGIGSTHVAIAAPRDDTKRTNAGAVYIFNAQTGALVRTLYSPNPQPFDYFGSALAAVGNNRILIGSYNDDSAGTDAGAAYLYDIDTGAIVQTFLNPTPSPGDLFGFSLTAMDDEHVAIGAPGDDGGASDAGAVHLFNITTGAKTRTIAHPQATSADSFGYSLANLGSTRLAVGTPNRSEGASFAGVVYIMDPATGSRLVTIANPSPAPLEFFGRAIAPMGSGAVLVGVPTDDSIGLKSGTVYAFDVTNATLLRTIVNPRLRPNDQVGYALAGLGTERAIAGAWNDSTGASNAGATHVVTIEPPPPVINTLTASPSPAGFGQLITITASGVNAASRQVLFYIDSNDNGSLDNDLDLLLGTSPNNAAGTVTRTLQTSALSPETYRFFAVPVDERGVLGNIVQTDLLIADAPAPADHPIIGALVANPSAVAPGATLALTADNAAVAAGSITSVSFYRDSNNNGAYDAFIDELIATDTSASGGWSITINTGQLAVSNGRVFARAAASNGTFSKPAIATVIVQNPNTNHDPIVSLTSPADNASTISTTPTFSWSASDADGDALSYDLRITDLLGNAVRTIRFDAPGPLQYTLKSTEALAPADYFWSVVANDGEGGIATSPTRRITIATPPPNNAPTLAALTPIAGASTDDTTPTFTWSAGDADSDPLTFTLNVFDAQGTAVQTIVLTNPGTLEITLAANQALAIGSYNWTVTADDGKAAPVTTAARSLTIAAPTPVNQPPTITSLTPTQSATLNDTTPTFTWSASDPDSDAMTFTLFIQKSGTGEAMRSVTLSELSAYTYTLPDNAALPNGNYVWNILANDGVNPAVASISHNFTLDTGIVTPTNQPPTIAPLTPTQSATLNDTTPTFTWSASDPDSDAMTFTLFIQKSSTGEAMHSVTLSGLSAFTYTLPDNAALPNGNYVWNILANDGVNPAVASISHNFTLDTGVVTPTNQPPTITLAAPATGAALSDTTPTFTWSASDPDGDTLTFTFTLKNSAGNQTLHTATLSSPTYTLPANAALADATYSWSVSVNDGHNAAVTSAPATFIISTPTTPGGGGDPSDANDTPATATPSTPDGSTTPQTLPPDAPNDIDWFAFTLAGLSFLDINTAPTAASQLSGQLKLSLYHAGDTATPIASVAGSFADLRLRGAAALSGGDYLAKIERVPGQHPPGAYDISILATPVTELALGADNPRTLKFTDADGTAVSLALKNAAARIFLAGSDIATTTKSSTLTATGSQLTLADVILTATSDATTLSITGKSGDGIVTLGGLSSDGPIKSITGKNTRLAGLASLAGSLKSLTLSDATDSQLTVGAPADPRTTLAIKLASANAFTVISQTPIKSLAATDWLGDGTQTLQAPWFKSIAIKNTLAASLIATSTDAKGISLGSLRATTFNNTSLSAGGIVQSLKATDWLGDGGDVVAAAWFSKIDVRGTLSATLQTTGQDARGRGVPSLKAGSILNGSILASAGVGAIKVGQWIGGNITAAWIDTLASAGDFSPSMNLTGNLAGPALNKLTIKGTLRDGFIRIDGDVTLIDIGAARDATLLIGVLASLSSPDSPDDFAANTGTLATLTVRGIAGDPTAPFIDTLVAARVLNKVTLREVASVNGRPFGLTADAINSYSRTAVAGTIQLANLSTPGLLDGTDAFRLLIV